MLPSTILGLPSILIDFYLPVFGILVSFLPSMLPGRIADTFFGFVSLTTVFLATVNWSCLKQKKVVLLKRIKRVYDKFKIRDRVKHVFTLLNSEL